MGQVDTLADPRHKEIGRYREDLGLAARDSNNFSNVPFSLTYDCMQLSGEVYQYAVIPRGIAACNRDFTFYQKKLLKPNPGKPRQITSYEKKYYRILIFLAVF